MDVDWVAKRLPQNEAQLRTRLGATLDLVRDATQSLRSICTQLRPGVLDDLGLAAAIEWQATEFASRTGIRCDVSVPTDDLALDAERCTAIFRILQEALTNVARHAEAKVVRASLAQRNGRVLLVVQDDGKGIRDSDLTASKGSLGLLGIKERAQACGGELQVWGEPGLGTTLAVDIPSSDPGQKDGGSAHSFGR
jgi:signal transduction histidine kinase